MRTISFAEIKNLVSSRSSPEQEDVKVMISCSSLLSASLPRGGCRSEDLRVINFKKKKKQ